MPQNPQEILPIGGESSPVVGQNNEVPVVKQNTPPIKENNPPAQETAPKTGELPTEDQQTPLKFLHDGLTQMGLTTDDFETFSGAYSGDVKAQDFMYDNLYKMGLTSDDRNTFMQSYFPESVEERNYPATTKLRQEYYSKYLPDNNKPKKPGMKIGGNIVYSDDGISDVKQEGLLWNGYSMLKNQFSDIPDFDSFVNQVGTKEGRDEFYGFFFKNNPNVTRDQFEEYIGKGLKEVDVIDRDELNYKPTKQVPQKGAGQLEYGLPFLGTIGEGIEADVEKQKKDASNVFLGADYIEPERLLKGNSDIAPLFANARSAYNESIDIVGEPGILLGHDNPMTGTRSKQHEMTDEEANEIKSRAAFYGKTFDEQAKAGGFVKTKSGKYIYSSASYYDKIELGAYVGSDGLTRIPNWEGVYTDVLDNTVQALNRTYSGKIPQSKVDLVLPGIFANEMKNYGRALLEKPDATEEETAIANAILSEKSSIIHDAIVKLEADGVKKMKNDPALSQSYYEGVFALDAERKGTSVDMEIASSYSNGVLGKAPEGLEGFVDLGYSPLLESVADMSGKYKFALATMQEKERRGIPVSDSEKENVKTLYSNIERAQERHDAYVRAELEMFSQMLTGKIDPGFFDFSHPRFVGLDPSDLDRLKMAKEMVGSVNELKERIRMDETLLKRFYQPEQKMAQAYTKYKEELDAEGMDLPLWQQFDKYYARLWREAQDIVQRMAETHIGQNGKVDLSTTDLPSKWFGVNAGETIGQIMEVIPLLGGWTDDQKRLFEIRSAIETIAPIVHFNRPVWDYTDDAWDTFAKGFKDILIGEGQETLLKQDKAAIVFDMLKGSSISPEGLTPMQQGDLNRMSQPYRMKDAPLQWTGQMAGTSVGLMALIAGPGTLTRASKIPSLVTQTAKLLTKSNRMGRFIRGFAKYVEKGVEWELMGQTISGGRNHDELNFPTGFLGAFGEDLGALAALGLSSQSKTMQKAITSYLAGDVDAAVNLFSSYGWKLRNAGIYSSRKLARGITEVFQESGESFAQTWREGGGFEIFADGEAWSNYWDTVKEQFQGENLAEFVIGSYVMGTFFGLAQNTSMDLDDMPISNAIFGEAEKALKELYKKNPTVARKVRQNVDQFIADTVEYEATMRDVLARGVDEYTPSTPRYSVDGEQVTKEALVEKLSDPTFVEEVKAGNIDLEVANDIETSNIVSNKLGGMAVGSVDVEMVENTGITDDPGMLANGMEPGIIRGVGDNASAMFQYKRSKGGDVATVVTKLSDGKIAKIENQKATGNGYVVSSWDNATKSWTEVSSGHNSLTEAKAGLELEAISGSLAPVAAGKYSAPVQLRELSPGVMHDTETGKTFVTSGDTKLDKTGESSMYDAISEARSVADKSKGSKTGLSRKLNIAAERAFGKPLSSIAADSGHKGSLADFLDALLSGEATITEPITADQMRVFAQELGKAKLISPDSVAAFEEAFTPKTVEEYRSQKIVEQGARDIVGRRKGTTETPVQQETTAQQETPVESYKKGDKISKSDIVEDESSEVLSDISDDAFIKIADVRSDGENTFATVRVTTPDGMVEYDVRLKPKTSTTETTGKSEQVHDPVSKVPRSVIPVTDKIGIFFDLGKVAVVNRETGTILHRDFGSVDAANALVDVLGDDNVAVMEEIARVVSEQQAAGDASLSSFFGNDQVGTSSSLPGNVKNFVQNVAQKLGIGSKILIVDKADLQGKHGLEGSAMELVDLAQLGDGEFGLATIMGDGTRVVAVDMEAIGSEEALLSVVSHELGHVVQAELYGNASEETKQAIKTAYDKWLKDVKGQDKNTIVGSRADATVQSLLMGESTESLSDSDRQYYESFNEWFADQVAIWMFQSEKPRSDVEKFFQNVAEYLKGIYDTLSDKVTVVPEVKEWLDQLYGGETSVAEAVTETKPISTEDVKTKTAKKKINDYKAHLEDTKSSAEGDEGFGGYVPGGNDYSSLLGSNDPIQMMAKRGRPVKSAYPTKYGLSGMQAWVKNEVEKLVEYSYSVIDSGSISTFPALKDHIMTDIVQDLIDNPNTRKRGLALKAELEQNLQDGLLIDQIINKAFSDVKRAPLFTNFSQAGLKAWHLLSADAQEEIAQLVGQGETSVNEAIKRLTGETGNGTVLTDIELFEWADNFVKFMIARAGVNGAADPVGEGLSSAIINAQNMIPQGAAQSVFGLGLESLPYAAELMAHVAERYIQYSEQLKKDGNYSLANIYQENADNIFIQRAADITAVARALRQPYIRMSARAKIAFIVAKERKDYEFLIGKSLNAGQLSDAIAEIKGFLLDREWEKAGQVASSTIGSAKMWVDRAIDNIGKNKNTKNTKLKESLLKDVKKNVDKIFDEARKSVVETFGERRQFAKRATPQYDKKGNLVKTAKEVATDKALSVFLNAISRGGEISSTITEAMKVLEDTYPTSDAATYMTDKAKFQKILENAGSALNNIGSGYSQHQIDIQKFGEGLSLKEIFGGAMYSQMKAIAKRYIRNQDGNPASLANLFRDELPYGFSDESAKLLAELFQEEMGALSEEVYNSVLDKYMGKFVKGNTNRHSQALKDLIVAVSNGMLTDQRFKDLYGAAFGSAILSQKGRDVMTSSVNAIENLENAKRNLNELYEAAVDEFEKSGKSYKEFIQNPTDVFKGIMEQIDASKKAIWGDMKERAKSLKKPLSTARAMRKGDTSLFHQATRAHHKLSTLINRNRPMSSVFIALTQGSLLTGTSLAVNILGNVMMKPLRLSDRVARFFLERTVGKLAVMAINYKGDPNNPVNFQRDVKMTSFPLENTGKLLAYLNMGGNTLGLNEAMMELLSGGDVTSLTKGEVSTSLSPGLFWRNLFTAISKKKGAGDYEFDPKWVRDAIVGTFGVVPETMFRFLNLGDKPFRRFAELAKAIEIGTIEKGLTGIKLEAFINNPDAEARSRITTAGLKATFQQEGTVSKSARGAMTIASDVANKVGSIGHPALGGFLEWALRTVVPYVSTPANILSEYVKYKMGPLTLGLGMGQYYGAIKEGDKGLIQEGLDNMAKGVTGILMTYLATYLYNNGLITPGGEDDDDRNLFYDTFGGPYRINASGLWRALNSENPDWRPGDKTWSYQKLGILGMSIGADANFLWARDKAAATGKESNYGILTGPLGIFGQGFESIGEQAKLALDQSFLHGSFVILNGLLQGKTDEIMDNVVQAGIATFIPNSVQSILRRNRPYMIDNSGRYDGDPTSFVHALKNTLWRPFVKATVKDPDLPVIIDLWGNKVKQTEEENAWMRFVNAVANPLNTKTIIADESKVQFAQLYFRTKDNMLVPNKPDRVLNIDGVKYHLSNKQYEKLAIGIGQKRAEYLENHATKVFNNSQYSDPEKVMLMSGYFNDAQTDATNEFVGSPEFLRMQLDGEVLHDRYLRGDKDVPASPQIYGRDYE